MLIRGIHLAISTADDVVPVEQLVRARNERMKAHLAANPEVVNYMRRAMLVDDDAQAPGLLKKMVELTRHHMHLLRERGAISHEQATEQQILRTLVRQWAAVLLLPLVDRASKLLGEDVSSLNPTVKVTLHLDSDH